VEKKTVFIISCGDSYALIKRKESGLLAGLWQFPDTPGWLNTDEALKWVEKSGLKPSEIYKVLEREHVFTHIKWELRGYYLEVKGINDLFEWYTSEQIEQTTALPTAYKVFWNGLN